VANECVENAHLVRVIRHVENPGELVVVCCSVLQCVAVCCSILQCATVFCSVLQCVANVCVENLYRVRVIKHVENSGDCVVVCSSV